MGLLRVTAEDHAEISAHHARLHLSTEGETFVVGSAALQQSREVREVVGGLSAAGVDTAGVRVEGVRIASAGGLLLKNQKAEFRLSVDVTPEDLPTALGVIATHRSTRMNRLEWQFDAFEASIELGASAMRNARRKADAIAGAAGLSVMGIETASDTWEMPVQTLAFAEAAPALRRTRSPQSLEIGVEYSAAQTVTVRLTVDFRIG